MTEKQAKKRLGLALYRMAIISIVFIAGVSVTKEDVFNSVFMFAWFMAGSVGLALDADEAGL